MWKCETARAVFRVREAGWHSTGGFMVELDFDLGVLGGGTPDECRTYISPQVSGFREVKLALLQT